MHTQPIQHCPTADDEDSVVGYIRIFIRTDGAA